LKQTILLVEDEDAIREMIASALGRAGFDIIEAVDASQAEAALMAQVPSIILLDWMLPGISGIEIARRIRRQEATRDVPIIMLTARCEESDRLAGFDAGVDDYVGKPFSVRELVARVKVVLRRAQPATEESVIEINGLRLDPVSHRVTGNGEAVKIGPTEFRMLQFFMHNQERAFSRGQLLDSVWGSNVYVEERTVDVHVRRLRKALSPHGLDKLIQTVHGTGYRFSKHPD
jgi:two-component system, OmpR family, phosphate regulon response regulator PhoB